MLRRAASASRRRTGAWRWVRRLLGVVVACAVLAVLAIVALWPFTPGVGDAWYRIRAELGTHHAPLLTSLPSPDRVGQAVISTENSRFAYDIGVDPLGVARALEGVVLQRNVGAATLEQQLAKRLYTPQSSGLSSEVTDTELAFKLDLAYSKDTILAMYLSDAYFGNGSYGVKAAARSYFGESPAQLTWPQAALLAGLVQAPSAYDPYTHLAAAKQRQLEVLDRLVATDTLTSAQAHAAYAAPLRLRPRA